jgi:hypothetical protein
VSTTTTRRPAALVPLRLAHNWPYLVVITAPLLLFAPFLIGQSVLYFGTPLLQFYPWRLAALAAVRAGELPLWNPWVGNGAPLLANYQSGLLYPPNWLALLLPLDLSMAWLAALHLALAGAGMVALGRRLGLRPLGQAVAGLAFGLSQYLVARVSFLSINAAVAWLPWLVWAVEGQAQLPPGAAWRTRLRPAVWLAALVGLLLLAGHAQTAWYSLLIAGAWASWRLVTARGAGADAWRARLQTAAWLVAPLLLAVGLAAAQLLPTVELMQASPRAESAGYQFVMTYSFSPWRLGTLLAPELLGNPARGRFYGYGNYWEDAVYAGVLPLLLAAATVISAAVGRLRGGRVRQAAPTAGLPGLLGLIALASVALALGQNTAIFPFFYNYVPTFNLFQAPARIMLGLVFALALLAGLGADRWQPPTGRSLYWTRLGTAGAAAVVVVGWGAVAYLALAPGARTPFALQMRVVGTALGLAGLGLLIAGALSLLKARLPASLWTVLVVGFVTLDLLFAGYGLNPPAPRALYAVPTSARGALVAPLDGHRLFMYPVEEEVIKFKRLLSFETFGTVAQALATRAAELPNTAGLDGLASANNFDPLVSARYAGVIEAVEATQSLALLRMMNVSVLAGSTPRGLPVLAEAPEVGVRFYQLPGPATRAWVVHQARVAESAPAALAMLGDASFDPSTAVILEEPVDVAALGGRPDAGLEPLQLSSTFNTVRVTGTLVEPGWVVLADTYYPGWAAYVDGRPATILPANYAFRAVAVAAGTHTIEFFYQPRSFLVGATSSVLCLLVLIAAAVLAWPRPGKPVA